MYNPDNYQLARADIAKINGWNRVSPYFRVQNGSQIDIHCSVLPPGENVREMTAMSNVPADEADAIVATLNS